jgi:cysteine desulfurase family protein
MRAMATYLERFGGNPGRSGHRLSVAAGRAVYEARETVAEFFGAPDPLRVIFAPNATYAINLALRGFLDPGDRVVTTSVEHNSVMRPLRALEKEGVDVVVARCGADASLDPAELARAVTPGTKLVALTHASNVTGTILPLAEAVEIARGAGALFLLDAAQTAGYLPIDVARMGIDMLAFTGHKALQGPSGTGGLILGEAVEAEALRPLCHGGTGSASESEEQPAALPDKYEAGTLNAVGLAGLRAGIEHLRDVGLEEIRGREGALAEALQEGLADVPGVAIYGPAQAARRTPVVSIGLAGRRLADVALRLDDGYGVLARVGLQCAPACHRTLGTFPEGTIRLSPGLTTTREEVDQTAAAIREIASA